jgi:transposase
VAYVLSEAACDRCQQPAPRYSTAERVAIDLDLEQPVLLAVTVSVHCCPACQHYFRAQPPFLRPDAIYTNRVVDKAVQSVHRDGMALRRVSQRLAADFWVQPSEGMIRAWCTTYGNTFDFAKDYQPWVIREFSGILCVDEVYQGDLALLLAVDPAAPDGDRLVGYQLAHGNVSASMVESFLTRLRAAGIVPDEVITDGSALYPAVLAKVWPVAAHQLCLFHETRHVTAAVLEVIKAVRKQLPSPPPMPGMGRGGPLHSQPPSADPNDPATQRWHWRRATRRAGIAEMHGLAAQGLSQRAIARQTGHNRQTVKRWLQQEPEFILVGAPPDANAPTPPPATADQRMLKQIARQDKLAQVQALGDQGHSYSAIARQVGLHRVTVKKWLQEASPAEADRSAIVPEERTEPESPPAPWTTWEEVKQIRETLKEHRFLLLRRPEHLSAVEQAVLTTLLEQPGCADLRVARDFLIDWYRLWTDENRQRPNVAEAQAGFETWRADTTYAAIPALKRSQDRLTPARFENLSQFLHHPDWEATNNGAERAGRAFRHRQASHFSLRKDASIERSIVVTACLRKQALTEPDPQGLHTCQRGRRSRKAQDTSFLLTINQPQEMAVA